MSGGERGDDEAFELPLDGELDLHAFRPADVVDAVEGYVKACRERGVLRLRLAHGKGTGAQRASVQRLLAGMSEVVSFGDAPPELGGWGATVVVLRPPETSSAL